MKILVTGAAEFIGSALTLRLLERGDEVVGIDNHNDYYEPVLYGVRLLEPAWYGLTKVCPSHGFW